MFNGNGANLTKDGDGMMQENDNILNSLERVK